MAILDTSNPLIQSKIWNPSVVEEAKRYLVSFETSMDLTAWLTLNTPTLEQSYELYMHTLPSSEQVKSISPSKLNITFLTGLECPVK
jgi:hypothetical protein